MTCVPLSLFSTRRYVTRWRLTSPGHSTLAQTAISHRLSRPRFITRNVFPFTATNSKGIRNPAPRPHISPEPRYLRYPYLIYHMNCDGGWGPETPAQRWNVSESSRLYSQKILVFLACLSDEVGIFHNYRTVFSRQAMWPVLIQGIPRPKNSTSIVTSLKFGGRGLSANRTASHCATRNTTNSRLYLK